MPAAHLRRTIATAWLFAAILAGAPVHAAGGRAALQVSDVATMFSQRVLVLERGVASAHAALGSPPLSQQLAQLIDRPAEDVPGAPHSPEGPVQEDDPSLRLNRLEAKLRDLTGRIENAEHNFVRLQDDLAKFKRDMGFKLQDLAAARPAGRKSEVSDGAPEAPAPTVPGKRRNDAFDPDANPNAPGAPRSLGGAQLGGAQPSDARPRRSASVDDDANGPLDLTRSTPASPPRRRADTPGDPDASAAAPGGAGLSPTAGTGARAEFDEAVALLRRKQYSAAETNLQTFIEKHPRDRLVADAVYFLGETFALRGRQTEAAEQFLKVSTDYAKSSRAPEGMVKLGVSLNALGAKEQACATFEEVPRKFPNASSGVKNSAERESKRARC